VYQRVKTRGIAQVIFRQVLLERQSPSVRVLWTVALESASGSPRHPLGQGHRCAARVTRQRTAAVPVMRIGITGLMRTRLLCRLASGRAGSLAGGGSRCRHNHPVHG
jgi:hypothetical protein